MDVNVIWRKEGSLQARKLQNVESFEKAWDAFKTSSPGGSVPISGSLKVEGDVGRVVKPDGTCLVMMVGTHHATAEG